MRRWRRFKLFVGANGLDGENDFVEGLLLWLAAHRVDSDTATKWSTLSVYIRQVVAGYAGTLRAEAAGTEGNYQLRQAKKIIAYVDKMHADSDSLSRKQFCAVELTEVKRLVDQRLLSPSLAEDQCRALLGLSRTTSYVAAGMR
jgi:hypothetical protein